MWSNTITHHKEFTIVNIFLEKRLIQVLEMTR